jgi:hypothetical protein
MGLPRRFLLFGEIGFATGFAFRRGNYPLVGEIGAIKSGMFAICDRGHFLLQRTCGLVGEKVRREKALNFRGCNSRPGTGSLHSRSTTYEREQLDEIG